MFARLYGLISSHEIECFLSDSDELNADKLERIEGFAGEVIESEILITLLCCVGGKKGGDITCHFEDEERFGEFIELLNSMGLNCFVDFNPEKTEAENLRDHFGDEVSEEMTDMLDESEIRTHIFMTKNDYYDLNFFRKLFFYKNFTARYHRLYGRFLGFPEENVDCFVYNDRNQILKTFLSLLGRDQPQKISDWELAERNEEKLTEEEFEDLRAFVYSMYPDEDGSLEKALERARERRRLLEGYNVDTKKYIDLFTGWNE